MPTPVESFAETLSNDDRAKLEGSVIFALRVISTADHAVDAKERSAIEQWRERARERLGTAFGGADEASPEAVAAAADAEWPQSPYLRRVREILGGMPAEARSLYAQFVIDLALAVASASGGFLGMGEKVSGDERYSIRRLIAGLGITIENAEHRARLGA